MSIPTNFPRELLPEFNKFTTEQGYRLRKKWRSYGADKCADKHKHFCRKVGAALNVDPRTIHIVVRNRFWHDLKIQRTEDRRKRLFKVRQAETIDPKTLVRNGYIDIRPNKWLELNNSFTRGEIKKAILAAIKMYDLGPPYMLISQRDADKAFQDLVALNTRPLFQRVPEKCTRWAYKPEYFVTDWVINAPRTGNASSNFYHQVNRFKSDTGVNSGPATLWQDPKRIGRTLTSLWTLKQPVVNRSTLLVSISLRQYVASQFKPSAAKALYELFNSRKVYDPSSGWGDRLSGFMAAAGTEEYYSTDPNKSLYPGYKAQAKRYGGRKRVIMKPHGSEISGGMRGRYGLTADTIFTSPPYFDVEHYSNDPDQSYLKYSSIEIWRENFLYPTMANCWDMLTHNGDKERGGILAMNISDIALDSGKIGERGEICDYMNDYISTLPGARYLGCIGFGLNGRRPKSGQLEGKEGMVVEPIWLWAKGGSYTLDDYFRTGFAAAKPKNRPSLFKR